MPRSVTTTSMSLPSPDAVSAIGEPVAEYFAALLRRFENTCESRSWSA
jgi:hypothetical protein